jgi:DHA1 family inner membrane transport protein
MAYLRNSAVNLLNLHYGMHALALSGAGVFFLVFLLKAGVPIPAVFIAIALTVAARFLFRPLILVLAPRWGLRALVAFGTMFTGVQYLFLAEVHGVDLMLLGFCLSAAIGDVFYWTCYHAYFAALGDAEHRGHQIGAREALGSLAAIVGPLIGAWALNALGPRVAFGAAATIHVLAALPFAGTPEVKVARKMSGAFRAAIPGILLFAADGWIASGFVFVWQIALFLSLGESFSAFGGALALAGLVGAVGGLLLGRHIDAGHGGRAVWLTFAGVAAVTLLRAASTGSAAMAVAANALGTLVGCLYIPTLMTAVYNQAKSSPCALRFHVATEGGWDVGCAAGCLAAAGLTFAGVPLPAGILISLAGTVLSLVLLRRYYAALGIAVDLTIVEPPSGALREP